MNKRLPILSLLFVFLFLSSNAQDLKELTVTGTAKKLDSDLVARLDQNGNYCAAIQVISDMDGFSYDSNDGIVGKVENKPGKDIVYLTASERVLEIFKSGYEPLKIILSEHGITLKQKQVWQIKIAGEEENETIPVNFIIEPEGAILKINGVQEDFSSAIDLNIGEHNVIISKEGFQTIEEKISITKKKNLFNWSLIEVPDAGLQIDTDPQNATVYLNDVNIGETPISVFYPPGNYNIKITKDGYVNIENEILEVGLPQTNKSFTLEENVGYLTINTYPEAKVYFNNELISNPTNVKLPPKLIKIIVVLQKADTMREQIIVERNDNLVLDIFPEVNTGTIQVAVTPFDAKIELTGDSGEYYTSEGMKIFDNLPIGIYSLKVSYPGYTTANKKMELERDEKLSFNFNLDKTTTGSIKTGGIKVVPKKTIGTNNDFDIEMVFVQGGTFTMGCTSEQKNCSPDEKPTHEVTLSDYYIGKYEVTQKLWKKVMGSLHKDYHKCDNCAVDVVGWDDAQKFIHTLNQITGKNYRLPTEAEWEYAARGGKNSNGYQFAGSNNINEVAWHNENSTPKTNQVGQKDSNELEIYDMSGNAREWCSDWYSDTYYMNRLIDNPKGPDRGNNHKRVKRGGGTNNTRLSFCRVTARDKDAYFIGNNCDGFRLAHD